MEALKNKFNPHDYEGEPFYTLLVKFPPALGERHVNYIDREDLTDEEACHYLQTELLQRKEAVTDSVCSDPEVMEKVTSNDPDFFAKIETSVFTDPNLHLGAGTTARIKKYSPKDEISPELAIKYLVSPNERTLTAAREHDVLAEANRLRTLESALASSSSDLDLVKIPHTFFHHKTDRIQCYGMEMVDGLNLRRIIESEDENELSDLAAVFADLDLEKLEDQISKFYEIVHKYCLHGDIKPANIMLSKNGHVYIIDFGQSVFSNSITEAAQEQFENLKEDEITQTLKIVRLGLKKLRAASKVENVPPNEWKAAA